MVGLLMPNRPEYLAIWLGLTRIGARGGADQHQSDRRGAGALPHGRGGPGILSWMRGWTSRWKGIETGAMVWRHGEAFAELIAALFRRRR